MTLPVFIVLRYSYYYTHLYDKKQMIFAYNSKKVSMPKIDNEKWRFSKING